MVIQRAEVIDEEGGEEENVKDVHKIKDYLHSLDITDLSRDAMAGNTESDFVVWKNKLKSHHS